MRLKTKICKKEVKEDVQQRKKRKPAEQMGFSAYLPADHSRRIPFDPYGLSYIRTAASPCRAGACLVLLPFVFGALYLRKCCKKQKTWFYVLGLLLPAVAEKLTLYFLGAYLCGVSPFRVTAVMEAIGTIEPYALLFTRMPMRYAVNLLFFNWTYILCGAAFAGSCAFGLSALQKRVAD